MAAANTIGDISETLLFWPKAIKKNYQHLPIILFLAYLDLIKYIYEKISQIDTFDLHIPGEYLKKLLEDPVGKSNQIRIHAYYGNICSLEHDQNYFQFEHNKVQFHLERDLEKQLQNTETRIAVSSPRLIDRQAINDITMSVMERLQSKRSNPSRCNSLMPQGLHSTVKIHNNCPICSEVEENNIQVDRGDLGEHYLSESHQRNLLSYLTSYVSININSNELNNQIVNTRLISLNDTLNDLTHHFERFHNDTLLVQSTIESLEKQYSLLKRMHQTNVNDIANITISQNSSYQEILTKSYTKNRQLSNDGSFIWRITDIKEKRMDAVSQRQISIYSEPFYSSHTGYKLCLRLYLNGDGNARGTYLSLFLVMMRSEYDAIIHWPFKYKVIFTLLNQSQSDSPSKCFWPDVNSTCFQRPRTSMNIAGGIPKFFPLDIFKQTYAEYVQNDTMFVKVEVDFISERPELVFIPGVSELANDEKDVDTVHENIDRMASLS
ncbi:unnamed protein product [Adineta steineri]|uniref:MATH domain-containing protein n=1 Tax=Adineta steineri TaxID=433720 RepID=A0A815KE90_9BILA|nr:unnamed protein product [Adineta steineri]CAF3652307.1 unnamed protein product [Adineta steineri]CAF3837387.1 unnamed protein product [Adineta steineri]